MEAATIWTTWDGGEPQRFEQPVAMLRLEGADTLRFLHGQSSQDLALAQPGDWLSTCCISPTARMRALAEVLVDGEGALLVITAGDGAAVRQAFDRVLFPADAVRLGHLQGGLWVEPVGGDGGGSGPVGRWEQGPQGGWRLGRALVLPDHTPLPEQLAALPPLAGWARQFRRLRLGWPAAPAELNDDTNPFELGLADRVSLTKGCYVGQETLAKLATYDGVKQQLRRWHAPTNPGAPTPLEGATLHQAGGERAGVITSCLALPDRAGWVGLALVRRSALDQQYLFTAGAEPGQGLRLALSLPQAFIQPPVGAGGQAKA